MKILSQDMIDRARELIATAAADLVAANRIVVNSYGSHFVRRNLAGALSEARGALLNVAMTKLPASARSPKLRRMEGMEHADESRSARRLAKLAAADEVRVDWYERYRYERYRANAVMHSEPVMPFTMWLAHAIERNGGTPLAVIKRPGPWSPQ